MLVTLTSQFTDRCRLRIILVYLRYYCFWLKNRRFCDMYTIYHIRKDFWRCLLCLLNMCPYIRHSGAISWRFPIVVRNVLHIPAVPRWHVVQNNIVCRDSGVVFKVTLQLPKCLRKVANRSLRTSRCTLILCVVFFLLTVLFCFCF